MNKPIPSNPDDWFHADDPLPTDTDTLVTQIQRAAHARRYAAMQHIPDCTCCGCRVHRFNQARVWMRSVS